MRNNVTGFKMRSIFSIIFWRVPETTPSDDGRTLEYVLWHGQRTGGPGEYFGVTLMRF